MLLRIWLGIGGLVLLCALASHLRQHRRVGGGVVLAAAMLTLQAIVHPPSEQPIAQLYEMEEEQEPGDGEGITLREQLRRHANRTRSGQGATALMLRLSPDSTSKQPVQPERKDSC